MSPHSVRRCTVVFVTLVLLTASVAAGAVAVDVDERTNSDESGESRAGAAELVQGEQNETRTEQEPNDEPEEANPLQSGDRIRGNVSSGSPPDVDAFSVQATAGENVRVNATRFAGTGVLGIGVFGPDGSMQALSLASINSTVQLTVPVDETGEHLVVVAPASWDVFGAVSSPFGDGTGPYEMSVTTRTIEASPPVTPVDDAPDATTASVDTTTATATPDDATTEEDRPDDAPPRRLREAEPNDAFDLANPLRSGNTIRGVLENESDVDLYRVDVAAGQTLDTVLLRPGDSSGLANFGVYAPNGTLVDSGQAWGASTVQLSANASRGGTYFVGVWSSGTAASGPYLLSVSVTRQLGGTFGGNQSRTAPAERPGVD